MSATWLDYKGKKILYSDYRGLRGQPAYDTLALTTQMIMEAPAPVLVFCNFVGCRATMRFMECLKKDGQIVKAKMAKAACVGVTGIQEILFRGYVAATGNTIRPFRTEAEGLDWLVEV